MKHIARLLIPLIAFSAACNKGHDLVGTWNVAGGGLAAKGMTAKMTFNKDGTALMDAKLKQPPMEVKFNATYELEENKLTVLPTTANVHAIDPAEDKQLDKSRKKIEDDALEQAKKDNGASDLEWVSEDRFIAKKGGGQVTYEREKT